MFNQPVIGNVKNDLFALGSRSQHHDSQEFKHRLHNYFFQMKTILRVDLKSKNLYSETCTSSLYFSNVF